MAAACLRAPTILYLATISSLFPHLHHFQRSPGVLFFGCGYSSWRFVTSTEPGFNKCLLCQVNLVNTNLALSRPRSSVALWSKRGLTTLLIPRHDPPSDITIFYGYKTKPWSEFYARQSESFSFSRNSFACYISRRTKFFLFTTRAVTSSLSRQQNIYEPVYLSDVKIYANFPLLW